jgi:hypothetical protein
VDLQMKKKLQLLLLAVRNLLLLLHPNQVLVLWYRLGKLRRLLRGLNLCRSLSLCRNLMMDFSSSFQVTSF